MSLPQSVSEVKACKLLAVIRTHPSSNVLVELMDNSQHLLWCAEECEQHPHQLSVDGVIYFLGIDEAHV